MKTYISTSDAETQKIGQKFAKTLKFGDVVLLYGDLGAGKTTFVKGVAKGLGIRSRVISPTFIFVRSHEIINKKSNIKNTSKKLKMLHVDLYRIQNKEQLEEIGIKEIIHDKSSVKLIEWPEKLDEIPKKRIDVKFILNKNDTRTIEILESSPVNTRGNKIL